MIELVNSMMFITKEKRHKMSIVKKKFNLKQIFIRQN